MRRTRNAKIVATLGPASSDAEVVRSLFLAGVDVFRLNFSHGSGDDHRQRLNTLRALEARDRPADRHHGRPAGPQAARRRVRRRVR